MSDSRTVSVLVALAFLISAAAAFVPPAAVSQSVVDSKIIVTANETAAAGVGWAVASIGPFAGISDEPVLVVGTPVGLGESNICFYSLAGTEANLINCIESFDRDGTPHGHGGLGGAIVPLGDIDGDNLPDLLVEDSYHGALGGFPFSTTAFLMHLEAGPLPGGATGIVRRDHRIVSGPENFFGFVPPFTVYPGLTSGAYLERDGIICYVRADLSTDCVHSSFGLHGEGKTGIGDLNGDGVPDAATGDAVYIMREEVPTPSSRWTFISSESVLLPDAHEIPHFVGDLNRDGVPDLATSTPNDGQLVVWYLRRDGSVLARLDIEEADVGVVSGRGARNSLAALGVSVAPVGDVNGDSWPDLAVGSPYETFDDSDCGGAERCWGSVRLLMLAPPDDDTPVCGIERRVKGPPMQIVIGVGDSGSGLSEIEVVQALNVAVDEPQFDVGTRDPQFVTGTKIDPDMKSVIELKVIDVAGNVTTCDPVLTTLTGEIPEAFQLEQSFPNPFNPTTNIEFAIPEASFVQLGVFDAVGREVAVLVNEELQPGTYTVNWDATNSTGELLPSGPYFYRVEAGDFSATRSMLFIK